MSFNEILEKIHNKEKVDFSEMIRGDIEISYCVSYISALGFYRIDVRADEILVNRKNFKSLVDFREAFHNSYALDTLKVN